MKKPITISTLNKILGIFILIANVYYLPVSILILYREGGPMGYEFFALPFTMMINFAILSGILGIKIPNNIILFMLNLIFSLYIIFITLLILNL